MTHKWETIRHKSKPEGVVAPLEPTRPRPKMMWGWDIEEIKSAMRQFQSKHPNKLPSEIERAEKEITALRETK